MRTVWNMPFNSVYESSSGSGNNFRLLAPDGSLYGIIPDRGGRGGGVLLKVTPEIQNHSPVAQNLQVIIRQGMGRDLF